MLKGNKGEWSEPYALFKILGDKYLYKGDEHFKKIENIFYPVIKILRRHTNGTFEFSIDDDIVFISNNNEEIKIPVIEFHNKAKLLMKKINTSSETTFEIPEIEEFMNSFNCISLKADNTSKSDITIMVYDSRIQQSPTLDFSIKSQLGSPSTLLNASNHTNFNYAVENIDLSNDEITVINSITGRSKIKDRIKTINEKGGYLSFYNTESPVLLNNLILIDSSLAEILGYMLLDYFSSNRTSIIELTESVKSNNPLDFDLETGQPFYKYRIKRFLTDTALGMMPGIVWEGNYEATGGYLVVKEDGEVLCYHIYNKMEFENYLINNTKFETSSSSRHNYGKLYSENGKLLFRLNLQIRFIK